MESGITVTEAARDLDAIVSRAFVAGESTTILQDGKPVARVVPVAREFKTGKELSALLAGNRPRLSVEEAEAFEADLREARAERPEPVSPWA